MSDRQDKRRLRRVAELIRDDLLSLDESAEIRWRNTIRCDNTNTAGWAVDLGGLGRAKPILQLWLDRYPGPSRRYFWFGFYSPNSQSVRWLIKRQPESMQPVREIGNQDFEAIGSSTYLLRKSLPQSQFARPIYETYYNKRWNFYGIFDRTPPSTARIDRRIARRAIAFFTEVLTNLPNAKPRTEAATIFPRVENRQTVVRHLARERSSLLAEDCKIRDNYKCQICGMRFEKVYGELGEGFAEAHHIIPLSQLKGEVKTTIEDLISVCSNCHRMLHCRMNGKRDDVPTLRRIVRQHRKKH
jgi:5-methylcytosine-specific restriction endonuclease McrA